MRIAVLGDIHGHFQRAARLLRAWMDQHGEVIDVALQVGDAMPIRDVADMEAAAAGEPKYRYPGDFTLYHDGELQFPCPVLFIGGNHEPWPWLDAHAEGDWLNDWCYYLGRATSTDHQGLNVYGLSGIYHPRKSLVDLREQMPATHTAADRKEATFCIRGEAETLIAFAAEDSPCDVLLCHDWPMGLVPRQTTGNPLSRDLIRAIRPRRVFCGHQHRYQEGRFGPSHVICLADLAGPEADPQGGAPMYVYDSLDPRSGAPFQLPSP